MINLRKQIIIVCSICAMLAVPLCASASNMPQRQMPVPEERNTENFMPEDSKNQIPEGMERDLVHMQSIAQTPQPKTTTQRLTEYSPTIISMLVLVAGFMFITFYKRKRY